MVEEQINEGAGDPIKLLLMKVLMKQRNEMMDQFTQILWWLSRTTNESLSSGHFEVTASFKVQVNFDIPTFEGQIDVDALEKCLIY
jgi:hypothetical protein